MNLTHLPSIVVARIVYAVSLLWLCLPGGTSAADVASVLKEGDRIVVVGDSITGQSVGKNGYVGMMQEALLAAHPGTKTTLTALGGSGQNVGSWVGVEKDSRERHFNLDVPNVDVKATLDGGAEVVIIMLGMNNVLRPDTGNTPEAVDGWAGNYRKLIVALQERTKARVIALATPTLCTEDFASPKNVLMDQMSAAMVKLAAEMHCVILPVRDRSKEALIEGRSRKSDFHLSTDFVHPQAIGHLAIATGMLEGLGESAAAKAMNDDRAAQLWKAVEVKGPSVSYLFEPVGEPAADSDEHTFKIRYWARDASGSIARAAKVTLKLPEGWTASPAAIDAAQGEFTARGRLDHLRNVLTVAAEWDGATATSDVVIPAGWIVGVGNFGREGWIDDKGMKFDPTKGHMAIDEGLCRGIGFDKAVVVTPTANWHKQIGWKRYVASLNYPGGADPGSIDLSAVSYFGVFDVAYGARWIYSPTERSVPMEFDSHTFAGDYYLSLWVNGQVVRQSWDRKGTAELKLKKGWNAIVFKSNHLEWQWQFDMKIVESPGDHLDDLRFSTVAHQ